MPSPPSERALVKLVPESYSPTMGPHLKIAFSGLHLRLTFLQVLELLIHKLAPFALLSYFFTWYSLVFLLAARVIIAGASGL